MNKQHYSILGISPDATQDEIKKAYREKAKELHPDKNNGNDTGFAAVNRAYEILSDPEKKKKYDETGSDDNTSEAQKVNSILTNYQLYF